MKVTLELSLSTILELIGNTSNPAVATQLIEGSYNEPVIPSSIFHPEKDEVCHFVSFDKWSNKVTFSYTRLKWYNEDRSDWTRSKSAKYFNREADGIDQTTTSLETWIGYFNAMESIVESFAAPKDIEKVAEYAEANPIKIVEAPSAE